MRDEARGERKRKIKVNLQIDWSFCFVFKLKTMLWKTHVWVRQNKGFCLPNYWLNTKTQLWRPSLRAVAKEHPPSFHSLSLSMRETHDGREKHCFFIWLQTEYFIYLTEDVKSQKRRVERGRKYSFKENDSWTQGCATHESTMYCGCLWGCVQRGCVSIGNKSLSIPRVRTASKVSHSLHSSFSSTHRSWKYCG